MLENGFQRADSSVVERLNGIEETAVRFCPCPPVSKWADSSVAERFVRNEETRVQFAACPPVFNGPIV